MFKELLYIDRIMQLYVDTIQTNTHIVTYILFYDHKSIQIIILDGINKFINSLY